MENRKELISKITRLSQYKCIHSCQVMIDDEIACDNYISFGVKSEYHRYIQKMIEDEDCGVFEDLLRNINANSSIFEIHVNYTFKYPNISILTEANIIFRMSRNTRDINQWLKDTHNNIILVDESIDFYAYC